MVADRLETVVQVLEIGSHDNVLGMLHPEPAVERGLARSRIMRVVHADAYPRADVPHAAAVDHALHRIDAAVEHRSQNRLYELRQSAEIDASPDQIMNLLL